MLNKDILIELMREVKENSISELVITHDRVEIRTGSAGNAGANFAVPSTATTAASSPEPAVPEPAVPTAVAPEPAVPVPTVEITAPIPGTIFVAPANDLQKKPLPAPGTAVKEGDVIALVEAMKMFNEVYAPADGVIDAIMANNKTPVKAGDPVIRLKLS